MAGNTITTKLDLDGKGFASQLRTLQTSIKSAEGGIGKLKAGASGLGQVLQANAAEAATAAAAALVAFGVKSVKAFQDSALAAGKFADATGLSVEESSRLAEVASDIGVELNTVQGAVQKFNKAIGSGAIDLRDFGTEVVYAKDGTVDAYESFINAATAIGAIKSPTERAEAAQKAFGKSYGEIAELMEMDAGSLRAALAGVSDEQVIDNDELRKARDFRNAMDTLQDSVTRVQMAIGEALVPALTDAAEGLGDIADSPAIEWLSEFQQIADTLTVDVTELATAFGVAKDALDIFLGNDVPGALADWEKGAGDAGDATNDLGDDFADLDKQAHLAEKALDDASDAADDFGAAYDKLKGKFDEKDAWTNARQAVADLMTTMADSESSWADLEKSADDAALAYADLIVAMDGIEPEVKTQLITELDQGNLDLVRGWLDKFAAGVDIPVRWKLPTGASVNGGGQIVGFGGKIIAGATGGIVTKPTMALIGEAGPEAVVPLNRAPGASPLPNGIGGSGGGSPIYLTVNAGMGANGAQVGAEIVKVLTAYERTNGKRWRS